MTGEASQKPKSITEQLKEDIAFFEAQPDLISTPQGQIELRDLREELERHRVVEEVTTQYIESSKAKSRQVKAGHIAVGADLVLDLRDKKFGQEERQVSSYHVTPDTVGWLSHDVDVELQLVNEDSDYPFWFGDLSPHSTRTSINSKNFTPDQVAQAKERTMRHIQAQLEATDHRIVALRPLEQSPTREHTTLHPYKDDAVALKGLQAGNVRILVLEDSQATDLPVYLFASIAKHEDQERLIYGL